MSQTDLIQAIRQQTRILFSKDAKELGLWLIQFDGSSGILKCRYQEKDRARQLLESLKIVDSRPIRITTLSTSGTIRGVTIQGRTHNQ